MQQTTKGWVILWESPSGDEYSIHTQYFSRTKKECVDKFMDGLGYTFRYWKKKYGYRCVKADQTITVTQ